LILILAPQALKKFFSYLKAFFDKASAVLKIKERPTVNYLSSKLGEIGKSLEAIEGIKGARFWAIAFSFFLWTLGFLIFYLIFISMGINLNLVKVILGSSFAIFVNVLPIQSVAGLGSTEATWTIALVLVGLSKESAIATSFVIHGVMLSFATIMGGVGWLAGLVIRD
jgi:uncharacterized membrane protein YbhN (UPF0104 family)